MLIEQAKKLHYGDLFFAIEVAGYRLGKFVFLLSCEFGPASYGDMSLLWHKLFSVGQWLKSWLISSLFQSL
jgi:hypothetical protein